MFICKFSPVILFGILLLIGCNNRRQDIPLQNFLPSKSTSIILKIDNYQTFKTTISNNPLAKSILQKTYNFLPLFSPLNIHFNDVFVSLTKKDNRYDATILCHYNPRILSDSLNIFQLKLKSSSNSSIIETSLGTKKIYGLITKGIFIASTSKKILERVNPKKKSKLLSQLPEKFFISTDKNSMASIFINSKIENVLLDKEFKKLPFPESYADWLVLDLHVEKDKFSFGGVGLNNGKAKDLSQVLKDCNASKNYLPNIIPENIDELVSYSFSQSKPFLKNIWQTPKDSTSMGLFYEIDNIGKIFDGKLSAVIIHSRDGEATMKNIGMTYNDKIQKINPLSLKKFEKILGKTLISYGFGSDDFIVLSESYTFLSNIISHYKSDLTLSHSPVYTSVDNNILPTSNMLKIKITSAQERKKVFLFQATNKEDFLYINGILANVKIKHKAKSVSKLLEITLDNNLAFPAQFVYNHRTKGKDIFAQDTKNILYLIDYNGKVFWKKSIDERIIPPVKQVDLFANGRYQLAFVTTNHLMVIDRDGNFVKSLTRDFKTPLTQPLEVFDYEKDKNYRFVIVQDRFINMFDKKGKKVSGFNYKSGSSLLHSPRHFRLGSKDYITAQESSGRLRILNRKGRDRIVIKEKIDFSDNDIYCYKNAFTTTDRQGNIITIKQNAKLTKTKQALSNQHSIAATTNTLVSLSDNKLTIKRRSIDLDSGNYLPPKIFYINDIIYVSTTDISSKKTYLFLSDGELLKGFPVYGSSSVDMSDIDNDGAAELVVKTADDTLCVYKIRISR